MIEQRKLTKDELNRLLDEAPETETRNLKHTLSHMKVEPYDYFEKNTKENDGIVSDGRPIYFAALSHLNELWTVVNKDVKEQKSLYKISKNQVYQWRRMHGNIYATMEKISEKNMKWTMKMGFVPLTENMIRNTVTYILNGGYDDLDST